jgi:type II secretory pathway pseudopilin PulG
VRLAREDGMTLPELLVTLTIAMVISLATFSLVEVTMRRSGEVSARVDAVQRGRFAMDEMTRQLRSQVCLQNASVATMVKPRSVEAATADSVVFYADTRDTSVGAVPPPGGPTGPERRRISLVDGTIVEERWALTQVDTKYSHAANGRTTSAAEVFRLRALRRRVIARRLGMRYAIYCAPFIVSVEPVMKPASSPARNSTARAISSGSPSRPTGICGRMFFSSTSFGTACTISVLM